MSVMQEVKKMRRRRVGQMYLMSLFQEVNERTKQRGVLTNARQRRWLKKAMIYILKLDHARFFALSRLFSAGINKTKEARCNTMKESHATLQGVGIGRDFT